MVPFGGTQHQCTPMIIGFCTSACEYQASPWMRIHAPAAWWKRVGSPVPFMEARGTNGFTCGSAWIDWNPRKRIKATEIFPDGQRWSALASPISTQS